MKIIDKPKLKIVSFKITIQKPKKKISRMSSAEISFKKNSMIIIFFTENNFGENVNLYFNELVKSFLIDFLVN